MTDPGVGSGLGPLSSKVLEYGDLVKRLVARAKEPGYSREDWAPLTAMIAPLTELPLERWRRVMDVNVTGAWLCMRATVPYMRKRGAGAIVNQASIAAHGMPGGGDPTLIERLAQEAQLIKQVIGPDDTVGPLLFLVSDASKFMTGQTVVVDVGRFFLG